VTGANGGLGLQLVSDLLRAGVRDVACHYRSSSEAVSALLRDQGLDPTRHLFRAELTDEIAVRQMREAVLERFGRVWGVVNMAGGVVNGLSWKLSLADFESTVGANLVSTFLVTREFVPGMRDAGGGRIVNISSILAHAGVPGASSYCAAKAGIEGFTRAVAQEVASKGVTANCIALGYFDRGIIGKVPAEVREQMKSRIPLRRLGSATEIFPVVSYLLSQESSFMTGQVLHLNGGQHP
jgi:NAD(P)-dependent dehydrogenase (short-subunit alcohol dehydrogenase family)